MLQNYNRIVWIDATTSQKGKSSRRHEMAKEGVALRSRSVKLVSRVFSISESCFRYESRMRDMRIRMSRMSSRASNSLCLSEMSR